MWYFNDKRPWGLFIAWPGGFDVSSLIDSCNLFEPSFSTLRRRIWKRSFISTVRPTVCTNPSRKRSFSKTFFKLEKRQTLRFSVEGKRFEVYRSFWKTTSRKSCDLPARVFLKRPLIDAFSNFSGVVWKESICCVFREKPLFSNSSDVVWSEPKTNMNKAKSSLP